MAEDIVSLMWFKNFQCFFSFLTLAHQGNTLWNAIQSFITYPLTVMLARRGWWKTLKTGAQELERLSLALSESLPRSLGLNIVSEYWEILIDECSLPQKGSVWTDGQWLENSNFPETVYIYIMSCVIWVLQIRNQPRRVTWKNRISSSNSVDYSIELMTT